MTAAKKTGMTRRHFLLAGATVLGTTVVVTACSNANGTKVVEVTLDAIVAKMTVLAPTHTPSASPTPEATATQVLTETPAPKIEVEETEVSSTSFPPEEIEPIEVVTSTLQSADTSLYPIAKEKYEVSKFYEPKLYDSTVASVVSDDGSFTVTIPFGVGFDLNPNRQYPVNNFKLNKEDPAGINAYAKFFLQTLHERGVYSRLSFDEYLQKIARNEVIEPIPGTDEERAASVDEYPVVYSYNPLNGINIIWSDKKKPIQTGGISIDKYIGFDKKGSLVSAANVSDEEFVVNWTTWTYVAISILGNQNSCLIGRNVGASRCYQIDGTKNWREDVVAEDIAIKAPIWIVLQ